MFFFFYDDLAAFWLAAAIMQPVRGAVSKMFARPGAREECSKGWGDPATHSNDAPLQCMQLVALRKLQVEFITTAE